MRKFRVTLVMKNPWVSVDEWPKKPDKNMVLETFADEILSGNIDEIFEIVVEKVE